MDEQILKDFVGTAVKYNYDWNAVFNLFPELKNYDQQLLKDYTATAKKHNYDWNKTNSYFPEFGLSQQPAQQQQQVVQQQAVQQEPAKKKELSASLLEGGFSDFLKSEQPQQEYKPTTAIPGTDYNAPQKGPIQADVEGEEAWKRKVNREPEKAALPATDYMQGYLKEEGKGVPFKEDKKYDISFLGRRTQEQIDDEVPEFIKPVIEKIDNNLLRQGKDIAKKELDYYLEDAGFKVSYEENTISDIILGISEDSPKNAITITAPDGEVRRFKVMTDDVTEADKIKQFVKEKSSLISEKDYLYKNENRKFRSKKEIDNEVKNISNQENLMNDEYKKYLWMEKDIKYIQSELKKYKDFGEEKTPKYIQTSAYLKQLQDEYQALGEKVKNKAGTLIEQQKQLEKAAGKYLELQSEKGTFSGALYRGFMDSAANIYSQYVRLAFSGAVSIMPGSTIYSQEEFDWAYRKRLFDEGIIKRMDEPLDGLVMDKAKQAEISSQVDAELRDKFKKAGITGYYDGEKLNNVTTVNSIRENLSEFLNMPTATTKEYKEKLEKEGSFVTRGLLGLSGSIPAMLGGPAIRITNMFMMTTDAVMREMDNDPDFANISENEKALIALPIGVVGAALEEFGFRNLVKGRSVTTDILRTVLGRVPSNAPASLLRKTTLDVIAEMGIRGTTALVGATLSEAETGALQQVNEYLVKDIYNSMRGKKFDNPEFLSGQYFYDIYDAARTEAVGGFVMGVPYSAAAAFQKDGFQALDDTTFKIFEELTKDGDSRKFFVTSLKNKINQGEITAKQSQQMLDAYDQASGMIGRVPDEITDTKARKIAMDLISERKKLEGKREKYDDALAKPIQDKIDNINKQLTQLTQDAIQKQATGEVSLQPESKPGKEMEAGGPEAGPQAAPKQGVLSPEEEEKLRNNRRVDLFPEESEFADVIGGSGRNSSLSNYSEVNGVGVASYTNPDNGVVDVIMSGTSDNDYVGYVRVYENGKPTNRWTSKMSNESGNKDNFKTMISEVQSRLPENHEYTESTNISIDGVRVYSNQLNRGYEVLTDANGNPVTNTVTLNAASVQGLQQATTQEEKQSLYDSMAVTTKEQFDALRDKITALMPNVNVTWNQANNTVQLQLPVLVQSKKATTTEQVGTEQKTTQETFEQKKSEIEKITDPEQRKVAEIEFIMSNLMSGVGEASANKIREYADRIISGKETRDQVIQGLPKSFVDGIDQLLAAQQAPTTTEITPTTEVTSVEQQFTEQDRARKAELEEAMRKADKRRKNITVGETTMPKAEAKAELDALNQKEQATQQPVTPAVEAAPTATAPVETMTAEQEADLLEELMTGKKKEAAPTETAPAEPTSKEAIAKRLRGKKNKGLMSSIDFGISQALYNGALEFMASQVEKGTKLGNAIANTIKWIDEKMQGKKWNKGAFGKYMNDTYKVTLGDGRQVDVLRDDSKETAEVINGWYQPIEQKIIDSKQDKQPANKWAEQLRSKEEEDLWTGVREFLESKGNQSVSKKELLDFMKDNRVEIVEVVKGGSQISLDEAKKIFTDKGYSVITDSNGDTYVEKNEELYDYEDMSKDEQEAFKVLTGQNLDSLSSKDDTKYFQYQLPGGENYKEILITLPSKNKALQDKVLELEKIYENDGSNYNRSELEDAKKDLANSGSTSFRSSHFDEPNIITHLRMNTRTDVDGNKVLFLEEVQSDWGQQGKKQGFKDDTKLNELQEKVDKKKAEISELQNQLNNLTPLSKEEENDLIREKGKLERQLETVRNNKDYNEINNRIDEINEKLNNYNKQKSDLADKISDLKYNGSNSLSELQNNLNEYNKKYLSEAGTPAAPFVTDTNSWVKLGLKMALREAAAQGADKIAWTTGEQQNARYDLSKQVDYIDVFTNNDGTYEIEAVKGNETISKEKSLKANQLEGLLGKDLTNKIIEDTKTHEHIPGEENLLKTYRGDDLKVGGKGMKGFYDGIVPGVAKALIKEVTGKEGKITEVNIEGNTQQAIDVTPEMKTQAKTALPLFSGSLADAVRKNLTIKTGGLQSNILGVPIAIWNAGVLTAAKAIDASVAVYKAVNRGVKEVKRLIKEGKIKAKLTDKQIEEQILKDTFAGVIQTARDNKIKDEGIRIYLKRKNITDADIDMLLGTQAEERQQKLDEAKLPGYNEMMDKVDAMIARQIKRGIAADKLAKNLDALLRKFDAYVNATDAQKKALEQEARNRIGAAQRIAPSFGRILGAFKDLTALTTKEKSKIVNNIMQLAKDAAKDLAKEIKGMKVKGKITTSQLTAIQNRLSKVNFANEASVQSFVDYMANVFSDVEYAGKIARVNSLLGKAKENVKTKIGVSEGLTTLMNKLFSINPNIIPAEIFEAYSEIVEMMGKRQAVLTLKEANELTKDVEKVLDVITDELSNLDELIDIFDNYENKVLDKDGKIDFSATLDKMLEDGTITPNDVKLYKKYKNKVLPREAKEKKTEQQLAEEKKELIDAIRQTQVDESNLNMREERDAARSLISAMTPENLNGLTNAELANLLKVLDNINNGFFPHYAVKMTQKLNATNRKETLGKAIKTAGRLPLTKLIANIKSLFPGAKSANMIMVIESPKYVLDQVFGFFKKSPIYDSVFKPVVELFATYKTDAKAISEKLEKAYNKVAKSHWSNPAKVKMSQFKMMTYALQLEYQSNKDKGEKFYSAAEYIKETIKHTLGDQSTMSNRDVQLLEKILNTYGVKDADGNFIDINIDKLYDSFNNAEKQAIKTIQEVNASIRDKAMFTAAAINGNKIMPIDNYVHHNVLPTGTNTANLRDPIGELNKKMNPSTRAAVLKERTPGAKPLNFNIFDATQKSANEVLMDFHLTEGVRTSKMVLSNLRKELEERGDKKQLSIFNAIEKSFETALENTLTNTFNDSTFVDNVVSFITKQAYRVLLAGVSRWTAELASNLAYVLKVDPVAYMDGITKYRKYVLSEKGPAILRNIKSGVQDRVYEDSILSGRMIDGSIMNEAIGLSGTTSNYMVVNAMQTIYNNTLKKGQNFVATTADTLISTPDKGTLRPFYIGIFAKEFKKITGQNIDLDKIAANDEAYLNKFKEAIDKSKDFADYHIKLAGGTKNPFASREKSMTVKNASALAQGYKSFNNFMNSFIINEYIASRTGIYAMMGNGKITRKQGAAVLAGVVARTTLYTILLKELAAGVAWLFLGDDDEEDEEKVEKSLIEKSGQAFAGSMTSLILGRDFGNLTRNMINYGVEKVNENYVQKMIDGKYTKEDVIAFNSLIPSSLGSRPQFSDLLINMSGAGQPFLRSAKTLYETYFADEPKGEATIKKRQNYWRYTLPLEIAGHLGFVPLYKDVKSVTNKALQREVDKIKGEKEGKISREQAYKNYKTLEEFQLADPEGYDEYSKDGGLLDQYRKQQREKKEENKSEKEKELDVKYGRLPFKENSMREEAMQGYPTIEQMKEENPDLYDQLSEEGGALYNLRQHEKRMKELRENALGGYGSEADFKALNPTKYEKYISEGGLLYKYNKIKQVFKADASEKMSEAQYKRRYPKEYRENYGSGSNYQLESYDRKAKKRADEREKMKEARSYGY